MSDLQNCLTESMLEKTLESLPKTLDETYERILLSLKDKGYGEVAAKVLHFLAFSARPVVIEEVTEFFNFISSGPNEKPLDKEKGLLQQRDIFSLCSSLITSRPISKWRDNIGR
jgi:hypothetical protein